MARIVIVLDTYLPGFKAGGPIRAISHMAERLGDEFEFLILTADRDFRESEPYAQIKIGMWQPIGKAQVLYLTPADLRLPSLGRILQSIAMDLLYLNSFFSPLTIKTLLLRKLGQLRDIPVILAPRGEFNKGALAFKRTKKTAYLSTAKLFGLYHDIMWHATNPLEAQEIRGSFQRDIESTRSAVFLAPDLPMSEIELPGHGLNSKEVGSARIIFIGRIARMKNLDFALRLLKHTEGKVMFDIYGPLEDRSYWDECQKLIAQLPPNIEVHYRGVLKADQVLQTLTSYHLFFMPTHGENFGHAILEALISGCPVLISDQTPWSNLDEKMIGWDIPLTDANKFVEALNNLISMGEPTFRKWSNAAWGFGNGFANDSELVAATRQLLDTALARI